MSVRTSWVASLGISMAIVIFSVAAGMAGPPSLKYAKPVSLPALEKQELVAAPLDQEVYAATRAGFPDLRLLGKDNQPVAFVVRKAVGQRDETTRQTWVARRKPMAKPIDNGGLEITLELGHDEPMPSGLRLISPLNNFEHRVQVDYSNDGQTWHSLVSSGLVFDYAKYIDVRKDTLDWSMPAGGVRDDKAPEGAPTLRFRITIDDVTKEQESQLLELTRRLSGGETTDVTEHLTIDRRPFRIDRIDFFLDVTHQHVTGDLMIDYPSPDVKPINDDKAKQTIVTVGSGREPLTDLLLVTETRNFSRAVRVETEVEQGGRDIWKTITSGNVSRIDIRELDRSNLTIPIPQSRESHYRLVIENRDSAPLEISGIAARGPIYELVFLAEPKTEYKLAYGGSNIAAPDYDTAALNASLSAGYVPLAAKLGEQSVLSEEVATGEPLLQRLLNDTRLLSLVIVVLVGLLGWGLYQASRRVQNQLDE